MKAVIQRVKHSSVTVDGKLISKIDNGFMILLGVIVVLLGGYLVYALVHPERF